MPLGELAFENTFVDAMPPDAGALALWSEARAQELHRARGGTRQLPVAILDAVEPRLVGPLRRLHDLPLHAVDEGRRRGR